VSRIDAGHGTPRRGLSLTELVVVLAIIGVIAAILVPSFTLVRSNAARSVAEISAQGIARNSLAYALSRAGGGEVSVAAFLDAVEEISPESGAVVVEFEPQPLNSVFVVFADADSAQLRYVHPNSYSALIVYTAATGEVTVGDPSRYSPGDGPPVPGAVAALDALAVDGGLIVEWVPPAGDVDGYVLSWRVDGGAWVELDVADATSWLLDGFAAGSVVEVRVAAYNPYGTGEWRTAGPYTIATVPDAPEFDAVGGNASFTVTVTGTVTYGAPVTGYLLAWRSDSGSWSEQSFAVDAPMTISGLTVGVDYEVRLAALSNLGPSTWSAPATIGVYGPPGSPFDTADATVNEFVGDQFSITFTAPPDNGSPLTEYQYSTDNGVTWVGVASTVIPVVVDARSDTSGPLEIGVSYSVRLRAVNAAGPGPASAVRTYRRIAAASAPTITAITPGNANLSVAFSAPTNDGAAAITTYEYSTDNGTTWRTRPSGTTASPLVITTTSATNSTLTNGTSYPVRIRAVNAAGDGEASSSVTATPATTPGAPTSVTATAGTLSISLGFTAPSTTGGSAITTYEYSTDNGATWRNRSSGTTASPLVITTRSSDNATLVAGTTYTVRIRAVNAVGAGTASASVTATPYNVPGAPTITSATGGHLSISVAFTAGSANGSTITTYQYSTDNGATWRTRSSGTTGSPLSITTRSSDNAALVPNTTYTVRIRAVNAAGAGTASNSASATPRTDTLDADASLTAGAASSTLYSTNGRYQAIMQGDGNFVVYDTQPTNWVALWASGTQCATTCRVRLVNGTTSGGGYMRLETTTGTLVQLINGSPDTWAGMGSRLVMQNDGNLVLYRADGTFSWSTFTHG
jgi:prepilin-type N-terminal cleavage/methylation domain-containing protein